MGCSPSKSVTIGRKHNGKLGIHDRRIVNDYDKRNVKKTWKILSKDMPGIGAKIFLKIFSLKPEIKQIFPFRDCTGEELMRDTHFRGHASRFMQAVGAAVDNVNDLDTAMTSLLFGLGQQHIHYTGFNVQYFDLFITAMLVVFEKELNIKFTQEVANSWRLVLEFMISKLKEGYNDAILNKC
jgi:hemoglobin-like flavoprotein